jgi:signal transduction histidine kinase/ligand-binding sensor domain-containing protein/DNA-binding response OmpR family regulator
LVNYAFFCYKFRTFETIETLLFTEKMKYLLTLISTALFPLALFPAPVSNADHFNVTFTQISTRDGLSQSTVRAIVEDNKGFIWAGTVDGLNRYDGYGIVVYKPQPGNVRSLLDHRIKNVHRDREGLLWIKTYENEFCCYDPVTDSFLEFIPPAGLDLPPTYENFHETSSGDIWLWGGTDNALLISREQTRSGERDGERRFEPRVFPVGEGKDIRFLREDSHGTVWIGGDFGLYRITGGEKDEFSPNEHPFIDVAEMNDRLWFVTLDSCIVEYDLRRRTFLQTERPTNGDAFIQVARMNGNELLLVTRSSGVYVFSTVDRSLTRPAWAGDPQLRGNIAFIQDRTGGLWVYNRSGIVWYYNPEGGKVRKMELIPPEIAAMIDMERYNVLIDSEGLVWITTYGNGLFCYDRGTETLRNYTYTPSENSPGSDYLLAITEDRQGNLWIGSEYAGIIKVVKQPYALRWIAPEQETSIGKNNNVRTLYNDRYGKIWIGTKNGSLYVYDDDFSAGECIYKDLNPYTLAEDARGRLWVGTKGQGLRILDLETQKEIASIRSEREDNTSLSFNRIFNIFRDSRNRMWVGTFGRGLNLAEESPDGKIAFRRFFTNLGNQSYIRHINEDSRGIIWLGTSDGIIRFDPDRLLADPEAYESFHMSLDDPNSLNCNDIKNIFEDSRGQIWIGTSGGGLSRFVEAADGKPARFIPYTVENGLSGNVVSGILEDREQNLWISTESGLNRFDARNENFTVYRFSDKIAGNHFNENANLCALDGSLMWGSLDGLLVFDPQSFRKDEQARPITFTNFFVHDRKAEVGAKDSPLVRSISYSDRIRLKHFQNTFAIEFSSLSFTDPVKQHYMYILQNYDKQWSRATEENTATYKNLPPGRYLFEVRGTNGDGEWNEGIERMEIVITPPFWKSTAAWIVYALLLAAAGFFALRLFYKFNRLNNDIRLEKELTNHKLRFFTNISHEFRTPLTIIRSVVENLNGQTDLTDYSRRQINVLNRNSTLLTRLIDQLIEFRKLQNNVLTLDLENIDMVAFTRELGQGFTEVAEQKNIRYRFECDESEFRMFIDRRKIDKVVYNLLSNAFKFTPPGGSITLALTFDRERHTCRIAVRDSGIGIDREKRELLFSRFMQIHFSYTGTGIGLALVKEFVDVHLGKVWYEDNAEQGQGSVFLVELSTDPETYQGQNFIVEAPCTADSGSDLASIPLDEADVRMPAIDDSTLSDYKMLIIDDNDDIRDFLTEEFSKYFSVDTAEDGEKGLRKAIDLNPDLIICDVMMSGLDGFEVTRKLREDFQTCHIPIILLTSHSSTEHQIEGIRSGADAYITKPFSIKYLVARVFQLIEQREQLKKRFSDEYVRGGNLLTGTSRDKKFLDTINAIVEENLADPEFNVDKFAQLAKQRRTLFYKKVRGITGLSPNDFIKVRRLKRAAELLLLGEYTVAEVSYRVGFDNPFYFSKCFKAQYNLSPSKYGQDPSQSAPVPDPASDESPKNP